ncbi:sensor histidine kinase, partial [Tabrizicola sp.]|uniref:sensor histidine kinase n=1 Tax=Tabrizicola sp. TaxID=2005166 RepID=UPI0035AEF1DF
VDTGAADMPLFDDLSAVHSDEMQASRTVQILGRQWRFELVGSEGQIGRVRYLNTALLGLTFLLFAGAASYAVAARQNEAMQARAVAAAAARESEYRALLLQEMKHRIKNHIARIQSIARQSARGATDVKAFTAAFDARLQAMSAVQEILAGTAVAQAEVRAVLVKELQQSLDAEEVEHLIDGPTVRLDERQAHAFAMVVHELVTNAMKYGGLSTAGSGLDVSWSIRPAAGTEPPRLDLDWVEQANIPDAPPAKGTGFGSRLIEASLRGELSGTIEQVFRHDGLSIRISFPLSVALNPGGSR